MFRLNTVSSPSSVHDFQAAPACTPRLDLTHRVTLIPTVRRTPGRSAARGRPNNLLLPNHQSKAPFRKQASTSTVRSYRRRSPSAGHAHDKRDQEDHQEYEEQYLRDTRRRRGDATKPKNGCDDRDES